MLQPAGVPIERPPTVQALRRDRFLEVFELDARLGQLLTQRLGFKRPVGQALFRAWAQSTGRYPALSRRFTPTLPKEAVACALPSLSRAA